MTYNSDQVEKREFNRDKKIESILKSYPNSRIHTTDCERFGVSAEHVVEYFKSESAYNAFKDVLTRFI